MSPELCPELPNLELDNSVKVDGAIGMDGGTIVGPPIEPWIMTPSSWRSSPPVNVAENGVGAGVIRFPSLSLWVFLTW